MRVQPDLLTFERRYGSRGLRRVRREGEVSRFVAQETFFLSEQRFEAR